MPIGNNPMKNHRSVKTFVLTVLISCLGRGSFGASPDTAQTGLRGQTLYCELAVVGGGSGGFAAALEASRSGVDTILIEKADCLGGTSVRSGVNNWEMGAGGTGIPFEVYKRLKKIDGAVGVSSFGRHISWHDSANEPYRFPGGERVIDPTRRYLDTLRRHGSQGMARDETFCREHWHGVPFEQEAMAQTMLEMLRETKNCRVFLNTAYVSAKTDGNRILSATLADGRTVEADYWVDATGSGFVCSSIGCETMFGQESHEVFGEPGAPPEASEKINGVSLIYRVTPVEEARIEPTPEGIPTTCWWRKSFPVASMNHYPNGDRNVNMLPTMDGAEFMQRGYRASNEECRRRVYAHWRYLQTEFEEFRKYRLIWMAPALGIRESKRVVCETILTQHDLLQGIDAQTHSDIVCLADHSMDTHGGHSHASGELKQPYGIPYRCMIPKGKRNLLIACRAAGFTSIAASSARLSRTMMQLGQAAGAAAAIAVELNVDFPDVPHEQLRRFLRQRHVQLEHPMPEGLRLYLEDED